MLTRLEIGDGGLGQPAGLGYFSSISKLSQLTELTLETYHGTMGLELQPPGLQKLDLKVLGACGRDGSDTDGDTVIKKTTPLESFCLSHLTQLQQLRAQFRDAADEPQQVQAVKLPKQLRKLEVDC